MSAAHSSSRAVEDNDFRITVLHGILARKAANKDLYATSAHFPFLEKTKIELINGRRTGKTDSDKYRQVSTRTLKKVPHLSTNIDTERQVTTAKSLAPKIIHQGSINIDNQRQITTAK